MDAALNALLEGRRQSCDVLRLKHKQGVAYYINLLSVGFTADVATMRARRFNRYGQLGYVMAIFTCLAQLKRRPFPLRVEGNGYVQAVMNRIFEVATRQESLASAFRKLTARNLSIIPVVDDQHLVGIVTLQNLMHSMALLAESRKLRKKALNT